MRLLADWKIDHNGMKRSIELYLGDLSYLLPEHAVDVLVVSAFPDDYLPTPTSLIGALDRRGISVAKLAIAKEKDLRREFSCWLSAPLMVATTFRRILCIESSWRGTPLEIADDLFRVLAPCSISEFPNGAVAMPLIGAGDQGFPADQIMKSILRAAAFWFRRGLNLRSLKIVVHSDRTALIAQKAFIETKRIETSQVIESLSGEIRDLSRATNTDGQSYEVFLSYSHSDSETAMSVVNSVKRAVPEARVFYDRKVLSPGSSWLMQIAESLDSAKFVVALFKPNYWESNYCKDEFAAAFMRQRDRGETILFPIYFHTAKIPYMFRTIEFAECREGDLSRLTDACQSLCRNLV
jgi:hypothetical protein